SNWQISFFPKSRAKARDRYKERMNFRLRAAKPYTASGDVRLWLVDGDRDPSPRFGIPARAKRHLLFAPPPKDFEMQLDRRNLCSLLPLALVTKAWTSREDSLKSGTFPFNDLQPRQNANGSGEVRSITKGTIPTGEQVEVHETALHPGGSPHPPHR